MRLSSSSSLVFATLAISSSSSMLSALAAPAGDPAQAKSGVSAPNNHFMAARRGSVSVPRSQADDKDETRSEEQVVARQLLGDTLCTILAPVVGMLPPLGLPICPPTAASGPTAASFDAQSVNSDDASNSTSVAPTSSDAATATETAPPSRRDVQPTAIPDKVGGTVDSTAPIGKLPINPADKAVGTFDGTAGTAVSQAPAAVGDAAPGVVTGGAGSVADTAKQVAGTVINVAPAPVKDAASSVPVRRSHRARRGVAPPPPSPPSLPVQPPSLPVQPPSPPVQPPVSPAPSPPATETAAPTAA